MTPEEKAKRYDEAFERVKELLSRCRDNRDRRTMVYRVEDIESIFSELKKSEDEKIKEDLIEWISDFPDMIWSGHYKKDVIAWLEKQGEQKQDVNVQINPSEYVNDMGGNGCYLKNTTQTSTWSKKEEKVDNQNCVKSVDDVKPKFKVGDWISNDICDAHIASIEDGMYYFDEGDGLSIVFVDEHYHLWTIEDAMDGDVLFAENFDNIGGCVFLFKGLDSWKFDAEGDRAIATGYCCTSITESGNTDFGIQGPDCVEIKRVHPATKEQRDLLFQKMHEAGYMWNEEKKELEKIESTRPMLSDFFNAEYERGKADALQSIEWSEEDEKTLNEIFSVAARASLRKSTLFGKSYDYIKWQNWLKSLRDRVQLQPKQEWSEEDEKKEKKNITLGDKKNSNT